MPASLTQVQEDENMRVKLVASSGEEYILPDGFMVKQLPRLDTGTTVTPVLGKDGGVLDTSSASLSPKEIEITGRLMDPDLLEAENLQGARGSAISQYFEIMAFSSKARYQNPMRIFREADIVIDPSAPGYDAALEPLGYYLNGYFKGGSTGSLFGENAGGGVVDVLLRFIVPNPLWHGLTHTVKQDGQVGNGQSIGMTFTNGGTADCYPVLIIQPSENMDLGPNEKVSLTIDGVATVSWAGSVGKNIPLIFDTASKQVYMAPGLPAEGELPVWMKGISTNAASGLVDMDGWASREWLFSPGVHSLLVSSNAATAVDVSVEVRFTDRYFG